MNDQMSKSRSDWTEHLCARHCGCSTAVLQNNPACVVFTSYSQKSFSEGSQDPQKGGRKKTENHWELA